MITPMAFLGAGAAGVVEDNTNSVAMSGTPKMLLHLNGNLVDATGGKTRAGNGETFSSGGKFGYALNNGTSGLTQAGDRTFPIVTTNGVTFAAWVYVPSSFEGNSGMTCFHVYDYAASNLAAIHLSWNNDYFGLAGFFGELSNLMVYADWDESALNADAWNYVTASFKVGEAYFSLNGDVLSGTNGSSLTALSYSGASWLGLSSTYGVLIDEFAIADNWYVNANFTPPTFPWRVS